MCELQFGISVYPGLDNTHEENIQLIKSAADKGCRRLFTSFHLPETNNTTFKAEIFSLVSLARELNFEIISDVSRETCNLLGISDLSPDAFRDIGISTLRLDDGWNSMEIASFSNNQHGLKIQLNASTITKQILDELTAAGAKFANIDSLHNFYPRPETGLTEKTLQRITALLHEYGIKTGAFVSSQNRRRSPFKAGLPTLEMHRDLNVSLASRHLAAIGLDSIIISDSLPSESELAALTGTTSDCLTLHATMLTNNKKLQQFLQETTFTARLDEARDVIRAQESRSLLKKQSITVTPENTVSRDFGSVTIDNNAYARYMGELQIPKINLPADDRVNVVAKIDKDNLFLSNFITPGKRFQFIF